MLLANMFVLYVSRKKTPKSEKEVERWNGKQIIRTVIAPWNIPPLFVKDSPPCNPLLYQQCIPQHPHRPLKIAWLDCRDIFSFNRENIWNDDLLTTLCNLYSMNLSKENK